MYMRLVRVEVRNGALSQLRELYANRIIPAIEEAAGCRYAGLMQSAHYPEQCISLTLWDSPEASRSYETGGTFNRLMSEIRPYLSDSSEYKIQLSQDLTLEYVPVPFEPVVKAYPIAAGSAMNPPDHGAGNAMWLRIVSLKIMPGKLEEFKRLYIEQTIPALRAVKGCRYVYLLESDERSDEVLSVTSWESKRAAEAYEASGLYDQLLERHKHIFSGLYQWKRSLGKEKSVKPVTSEDVMVEEYTVLVAKNFT